VYIFFLLLFYAQPSHILKQEYRSGLSGVDGFIISRHGDVDTLGPFHMGSGGFAADNDHGTVKKTGGCKTAFTAVRIGIKETAVTFSGGTGEKLIQGIKPPEMQSELGPHTGTHSLVAPGIDGPEGVPQLSDTGRPAAPCDSPEIAGIADTVQGKKETAFDLSGCFRYFGHSDKSLGRDCSGDPAEKLFRKQTQPFFIKSDLSEGLFSPHAEKDFFREKGQKFTDSPQPLTPAAAAFPPSLPGGKAAQKSCFTFAWRWNIHKKKALFYL
jgi:hypothetical protein